MGAIWKCVRRILNQKITVMDHYHGSSLSWIIIIMDHDLYSIIIYYEKIDHYLQSNTHMLHV